MGQPGALGQHIGIIALSSPCEDSRFRSGLRVIESLGLRPFVALDPCRYFGKTDFLFASDSPVRRARALEELFTNHEVGAIMAARGAHGSIEVLEHLDFSLIAANPKPFVGFSDATAVLLALYGRGMKNVVHGPSVESAFSRAGENDAARRSAESLVNFLMGRDTNPLAGAVLNSLTSVHGLEGPLLGGNLSILASLIGTPWEPDFSGHVLFLEEVFERPYRIHRMLLQLRLAGKFEALKGVVLGSFTNCNHPQGLGPSFEQVLRSVFEPLHIPIYGYLDAGHQDLNLPVPLGVNFKLNAGKLELA